MYRKVLEFIGICVAIGLLIMASLAALIVSEVHSKVVTYENVNYALVLGAGLNGDQLSDRLKMRLDLAFDQLKDNNIPIIVSGGQGPDELISEADAMFSYLIGRGIDPKRLIIENKSTSTQENIRFSNALMKRKDANVVLFTSDYHMYRGKMLGKRMGWNTSGYSAVNPVSTRLHYMFREVFALMKDIIIRE